MTALNALHTDRLDLTRPIRTASRIGKHYAAASRGRWRDYGMWCLHVGLDLSIAEIANSYGLDPRTVRRRIEAVQLALTRRTRPGPQPAECPAPAAADRRRPGRSN